MMRMASDGGDDDDDDVDDDEMACSCFVLVPFRVRVASLPHLNTHPWVKIWLVPNWSWGTILQVLQLASY